ncbi:hypothetical protein M3148_16770 [Georgenia satyanarayanai]|uniref:hypothetical protein n=1 Tax=Georgenia satyanarayanai TaxID=860221 RepID=UPI00203F2A71|nr:hypothetical protein [Georgenia satyanarayanai]MCM3662627.1 hypothetical protein [Georgenia satyanarayanai]
MSVHSPGLEQRYRRLLRLFPPGYRQARGEEMVAVLMEAAGPGQQQPSPGEHWDLLRAAGARWARVVLLPPPAARFDAWALLSFLLPVLLLYPAAKALTVALARASLTGPQTTLEVAPTWPAWAVWVVGLALLVLGRRRVARLVLTGSVMLMAVVLGVMMARGHVSEGLREFGWLVAQLLGLRAMLATRGPTTAKSKALTGVVATGVVAASLYTAWVPHLRPIPWTLGAMAGLAVIAGLALTRYRYAVPPIVAVFTAVYVGRFGAGFAPRRVPLNGLAFDLGTVVPLLAAPLLAYLAAAMLLSFMRYLRPTPVRR